MIVQWKVIHNAASSELEGHLNTLASLDYEIYRMEYIQGNEAETGVVPIQPLPPPPNIHVNVHTTGPGINTVQTPFQNPSSGYTASATMSKTKTRSGAWIIIAYRVET